MIALFVAALAAVSPSLPVPVEGLRVIPASGIAGEASLNARTADIDGDGDMDLVFEDHALLAPFDGQESIPFPADTATDMFDLWQNGLYALSHNVLRSYRLEENAWQLLKSWDVVLPPSVMVEESLNTASTRFLYGYQGSSIPFILLVGSDGLWMLSLDDTGTFRAAEPLGFWPPPTYEPARNQVLWPAAARQLLSPARRDHLRVLLDGPQGIVLSRRASSRADVVYTSTVWTAEAETDWESVRFPPVPNFVQPCRLNQARAIHFAGSRWATSNAATLPAPIQEIWVSLDGGETFDLRRSRAIQRTSNRTSFIDLDGDGDRDWVVEEVATFDRGARDALSQFLSSDRLELRLKIYLQEATGFAKHASAIHTFVVDLGKPAIRGGIQFDRYIDGGLYDLGGDFNGDGFRDLMVRSSANEAVVFSGSDSGFSSHATLTVALDPDEQCHAIDINGDGRADLLRSRRAGADTPEAPALIHLSAGANL